MKDLHYDGDFIRDFRKASERWDWAGKHTSSDDAPSNAKHIHDETAYRLLKQVFGTSADANGATDPE